MWNFRLSIEFSPGLSWAINRGIWGDKGRGAGFRYRLSEAGGVLFPADVPEWDPSNRHAFAYYKKLNVSRMSV
jgi:hypothetical protein